ncbi:MAG: DUF2490 domain-containing protein [Cryomorphaceae bacterium]|nr:MAG: DUF2490 domain-containing protein [Cryomorphaceae bacterium]
MIPFGSRAFAPILLLAGSLFFMLLIQSAQAQNQVRPDPYGQWLMYFGDNKLSDKIGLHTELQLRNYLLRETVEQSLARVGLNVYLNPSTMATAGYAFIYTTPSRENVEGFTVREHRSWQQLIMRQRSRNLFLEHRYRLEQRFIDNLDTRNSKFENRVRYRLQAIVPFYTISPYLRHFFFASYNELFVNFGKQVAGEVFDRNRFYLAFGYQFSPKFNFQVGYLHQYISIPGATSGNINHNLQVGISYNMDDLMPTMFRRSE